MSRENEAYEALGLMARVDHVLPGMYVSTGGSLDNHNIGFLAYAPERGEQIGRACSVTPKLTDLTRTVRQWDGGESGMVVFSITAGALRRWAQARDIPVSHQLDESSTVLWSWYTW